MIGDAINVKHIKSPWDEILCLAASIKQGTVTANSEVTHIRMAYQ
ncbi:Transposase (plasmid) [Candidatus Protochlamydia naegleriophila]|uniref:Transposase n=1 Tax=Candidatus Protochlamydia naegleriophila TaxID=389348 RepID=A0A0U5CSU2_9BACT|nr:Transposase [Candidatus Protochlamydia naegleriophila]